MSELERRYDLREISSWPIEALGVHCVVFEATSPADREELIARLERDAAVRSVQPMNVFQVQSSRYDDPYRDLQHGVTSLQVERAHRWADGSGVTVAVIDTGLDADHPELARRIAQTHDFVDDRTERFDPEWHGTAVAGVIASIAGNGIGIVGVAPGAKILALRACWAIDETGGACNSFTLARALAHAVDRRSDIINMSLAGPSDPLLEELLRVALDRGILVVAADSGLAEAPFPSSSPGVVGVTSPSADGARIAAAEGGDRLVAPGDEIVTTVPGARYDFVSGSSLAAAHVSGIAALVLQRSPRLLPARIAGLLRDSAAGSWPATVNACRALAAVSRDVICDEPASDASAVASF